MAVYDQGLVDPVPKVLRHKYLMRGQGHLAGQVRVCHGLGARVSFRRLRLVDVVYDIKDKFDVIFCRNVLIYFDRKVQESVICKICRNLSPGGYLFVGHSESLTGMDIPVQQVETAIFRMPRMRESGRSCER